MTMKDSDGKLSKHGQRRKWRYVPELEQLERRFMPTVSLHPLDAGFFNVGSVISERRVAEFIYDKGNLSDYSASVNWGNGHVATVRIESGGSNVGYIYAGSVSVVNESLSNFSISVYGLNDGDFASNKIISNKDGWVFQQLPPLNIVSDLGFNPVVVAMIDNPDGSLGSYGFGGFGASAIVDTGAGDVIYASFDHDLNSNAILIKADLKYTIPGTYQIKVIVKSGLNGTTKIYSRSVNSQSTENFLTGPPPGPFSFEGAPGPPGVLKFDIGQPIYVDNLIWGFSTHSNRSYSGRIIWGDGAITDLPTLQGKREIFGSHSYSLPGVYHISVIGIDNDFNTQTIRNETIHIVNIPPYYPIIVNAFPISVIEGETWSGQVGTIAPANNSLTWAEFKQSYPSLDSTGPIITYINWDDANRVGRIFGTILGPPDGKYVYRLGGPLSGIYNWYNVITSTHTVAQSSTYFELRSQAIPNHDAGENIENIPLARVDFNPGIQPTNRLKVEIEWGDGTSKSEFNYAGEEHIKHPHIYSSPGFYEISITMKYVNTTDFWYGVPDRTVRTGVYIKPNGSVIQGTSSFSIPYTTSITLSNLATIILGAGEQLSDYKAVLDIAGYNTICSIIPDGQLGRVSASLGISAGKYLGKLVVERAGTSSQYIVDVLVTQNSPLIAITPHASIVSANSSTEFLIGEFEFLNPDPFIDAGCFRATVSWGDNNTSNLVPGSTEPLDIRISKISTGRYQLYGKHSYKLPKSYLVSAYVETKSGNGTVGLISGIVVTHSLPSVTTNTITAALDSRDIETLAYQNMLVATINDTLSDGRNGKNTKYTGYVQLATGTSAYNQIPVTVNTVGFNSYVYIDMEVLSLGSHTAHLYLRDTVSNVFIRKTITITVADAAAGEPASVRVGAYASLDDYADIPEERIVNYGDEKSAHFISQSRYSSVLYYNPPYHSLNYLYDIRYVRHLYEYADEFTSVTESTDIPNMSATHSDNITVTGASVTQDVAPDYIVGADNLSSVYTLGIYNVNNIFHNVPDSIDIHWGDGEISSGNAISLGNTRFVVSGIHRYADGGKFHGVVIIHYEGNSYVYSFTANVTDTYITRLIEFGKVDGTTTGLIKIGEIIDLGQNHSAQQFQVALTARRSTSSIFEPVSTFTNIRATPRIVNGMPTDIYDVYGETYANWNYSYNGSAASNSMIVEAIISSHSTSEVTTGSAKILPWTDSSFNRCVHVGGKS